MENYIQVFEGCIVHILFYHLSLYYVWPVCFLKELTQFPILQHYHPQQPAYY